MGTTKSRSISCVGSCSVRDAGNVTEIFECAMDIVRHAVVSGVVTVDGQLDRSSVIALSR